MTLDQLRIFVAVADRLHFTRAAEALGLTQSAVSAAVATLEERYGVALFHRVGRRVELTSDGTLFLAEARSVLASARHAEEALSGLSGLTRGRLLLMGSQTTATYWLPPLIHAFRLSYPGIAVTLAIGNSTQVAAAVASGEVELGFIEGEVDAPGLTMRAIRDDRLVMVVGGSHEWAADRALEAADLKALPWLIREPGSGTRAATEALLARRGLTLADVDVALELPSNEAVRIAAEAGAGATVLSLLVVATSLKAGLLKAAACVLPSRRFSSLRHKDRRPSRAARAFLDLAGGRELARDAE
jgi:DNA-binding transcriptional LysR family regulator